MELIKKVYTEKKKEYLNSKGEKVIRTQEMYFLVFDNGVRIAIKPVFAKDWSCFDKLYTRKVYDKKLDVNGKDELPF